MNTKEKIFISAVIYAHNSEANVIGFLKTLSDFLDQKFESYEMILVNDASTDGTFQLKTNRSISFKGN